MICRGGFCVVIMRVVDVVVVVVAVVVVFGGVTVIVCVPVRVNVAVLAGEIVTLFDVLRDFVGVLVFPGVTVRVFVNVCVTHRSKTLPLAVRTSAFCLNSRSTHRRQSLQ